MCCAVKFQSFHPVTGNGFCRHWYNSQVYIYIYIIRKLKKRLCDIKQCVAHSYNFHLSRQCFKVVVYTCVALFVSCHVGQLSSGVIPGMLWVPGQQHVYSILPVKEWFMSKILITCSTLEPVMYVYSRVVLLLLLHKFKICWLMVVWFCKVPLDPLWSLFRLLSSELKSGLTSPWFCRGDISHI